MSQEQNMRRQLERLGGTIYEAEQVTVDEEAARCFVPSSQLVALRRKALEALDNLVLEGEEDEEVEILPGTIPYPREYEAYPYLFNVSNNSARACYAERGVKEVGMAFELGGGGSRPLLMQCRHCIRRLLGCCTRKTHQRTPWREPLSLQLPDGRRFLLQFDCQQCQMNVYAEK